MYIASVFGNIYVPRHKNTLTLLYVLTDSDIKRVKCFIILIFILYSVLATEKRRPTHKIFMYIFYTRGKKVFYSFIYEFVPKSRPHAFFMMETMLFLLLLAYNVSVVYIVHVLWKTLESSLYVSYENFFRRHVPASTTGVCVRMCVIYHRSSPTTLKPHTPHATSFSFMENLVKFVCVCTYVRPPKYLRLYNNRTRRWWWVFDSMNEIFYVYICDDGGGWCFSSSTFFFSIKFMF